MLPEVTGLFAVPSDVQLKTSATARGTYFSFALVAQDNNDKKQQYHRYNANMWTPQSEESKWVEKLRPGNIFILAGGVWKSKEFEGSKYPMAILEIDFRKFKLLKTPLWEVVEENRDKIT